MKKIIWQLFLFLTILLLIALMAIHYISFKGGEKISGNLYKGVSDPTYQFCQDLTEIKGHILDFSLNHSDAEVAKFLRDFKTPNQGVTKLSKVIDYSNLVKMSRDLKHKTLETYSENYTKIVTDCMTNETTLKIMAMVYPI